MNDRVYIKDIRNHLGNRIKIQGFVDNIRNSKSMIFIVLKDITGKLQVTLEKEQNPALAERLEHVTNDSVLTVWGTAAENSGNQKEKSGGTLQHRPAY